MQVARDPNEKFGPVGDVVPGQVMSYTITYENEGQGTAFGVYIEDRLGENFDDSTIQVFGPGQYIPASRMLTWDIGELTPKGQPGSTGTISFTVRLKTGLASGTVITNTAVVYFPSVPETTPTNVVVNVVQPLRAVPRTLRTPAMTPIEVRLEGVDASNASLTFIIVDEPLSGVLSGSGANRTYTPATNFTGNDQFTFRVSNGITASRPAAVQIIVEPSSSDTIRPTILGADPSSGASDVKVSATAAYTGASGGYYGPAIAIQFSEAMSSTSIMNSTIQLLDQNGQVVPAFVGYDEARDQAVVVPRVALRGTSSYTVLVSRDVRDASGNTMAVDYVLTFRTAVSPSQLRLFVPFGVKTAAGW